jgi:hypothetical protein
MPLDRNKVVHIRNNLRKIFAQRTVGVTLTFHDGSTKLVPAIWKVPALDDAQMVSQNRDYDALMQVNLLDATLAELEAAVCVTPSSFEGAQGVGLASRYLIEDIQPKGMAWPPNRAHVYLMRAE